MRLLVAIAALVASLGVAAGLGTWLPQAHRYLDVMLLPLAWYALGRSQRAAMLVGCGAGLLQDAWLQTGVFGLHGFSKTLLGWALGGIALHFDLNRPWGRFLAGALLFLGERLVERGLLMLLDQQVASVVPADLAIGSLANGLLVATTFAIVDRGVGRVPSRGAVRRRA